MLYEIEQFTVRHCYISKKVFQIKYQLENTNQQTNCYSQV